MRHDDRHGGGGDGLRAIGLAARRSFTTLRTLRAYWEALRDGRDMPARSEIDPRGIENALSESFIAERIAPGVLRIRIGGQVLRDFMGMEVAGMPLTALVEPDAREPFAIQCERVFAGPAIAEFSLHASPGFGRPALEGQMLLLPLRGSDGGVNRVLGGFALSGRIGRTPRRVSPAQIRLTPIAASAPDPQQPQDTEAAHGFAETPAGFAPAPERPAQQRAPHLRLVKND